MSNPRPRQASDLELRLIDRLNRYALAAGKAPAFRVETDHLDNVMVKYDRRKPLFLTTEIVMGLLGAEDQHQLAELAQSFLTAEKETPDSIAAESETAGWGRKELARLELALEREPHDPEAAARAYGELLREGHERRPAVLIVAVLAPLIVAPLVVDVTLGEADARGWVAFLLLFFGGFYPPFLMASRWISRRRGVLERLSDFQRLFLPVTEGIRFFFEKLEFVLAVSVYALVVGLPWYLIAGVGFHLFTGTPWLSPPAAVIDPLVTGALVLGALVALSDVDLSLAFDPRRALPELVVGLWHSRTWNIKLLASFAIAAVVTGAGPLGLLYDNLSVALAGLGLAGLLNGLGLWRLIADDRLSCLTWIALARTEVRRGRLASARWRLREINTFAVRPPPVAHLVAEALIRRADPNPRVRRNPALGALIEEATSAATQTAHHAKLWSLNVHNTRDLLRERRTR